MSKIVPEILIELEELFNAKGWIIDDETENPFPLFKRYTERLKLLNQAQQRVFIKLSYSYTQVKLPIYLRNFYDSLCSLKEEIYNSSEKIFVYPLLDPNKKVSLRTKSAGFLHYMFSTDDYRWLSNKFIPHYSMSVIKSQFNNNNCVLLLVDDYVGSGDTASEICQEYLKAETIDGTIQPENIKIVSIAAQKQGIEKLKTSLNIDVVSAIVLKKGISDAYIGEEKELMVQLMQQIEDTLNIGDDYRFGYKQTEALITLLEKTPNNTFPVYWHETRKKVAPFPRYKNFSFYG